MPFCSVIWPLSPARNARVPAGLKDLYPCNAVGLANKELAVLIRPQCASNLWWILPPMDELAMKALAEATKEFHGDTHRTISPLIHGRLRGMASCTEVSWNLRSSCRNLRRYSPQKQSTRLS